MQQSELNNTVINLIPNLREYNGVHYGHHIDLNAKIAIFIRIDATSRLHKTEIIFTGIDNCHHDLLLLLHTLINNGDFNEITNPDNDPMQWLISYGDDNHGLTDRVSSEMLDFQNEELEELNDLQYSHLGGDERSELYLTFECTDYMS